MKQQTQWTCARCAILQWAVTAPWCCDANMKPAMQQKCPATVMDRDDRMPHSYPCGKTPIAGSQFCKRHTPATGSETWFRVERSEYSHSTQIVERVFNGSTENLLIDGVRREAKRTQYYQWFSTREAAKAAIIQRAAVKLGHAEHAVKLAQEMLEKAKAL